MKLAILLNIYFHIKKWGDVNMDKQYFYKKAYETIITENMKRDFISCELNISPRERCENCSWYGKLIKSPYTDDYIPLCAIEDIGDRIRNECEGYLKGE